MIVLDTDHLSTLQFDETEDAARLKERLSRVDPGEVATTIITVAAIVRAYGATLLSANLSDFGRIPGLQVEGWLQE